MSTEKASLARVKIKFPEDIWISDIFKKFPDVRMNILFFLPYDFEELIGNSFIEIFHYKPQAIIKHIKKHKSVVDFSLVEKENNRLKINVKTKDPYLLYAVIKCGVLVDFPVRIRDGNAYWKLVSSREGIDKLLTIFEKKNLDFELLRIGNSPFDLKKKASQLTIEESQVLDQAISLGFFDIPRNISLEQLANKLGKSKSSLSVMLRKIIKKKVVLES